MGFYTGWGWPRVTLEYGAFFVSVHKNTTQERLHDTDVVK